MKRWAGALFVMLLGACLVGCGDDEGETTAGVSDTTTTSSAQRSSSTTTTTGEQTEAPLTTEQPPTGAVSPIVATETVLTTAGNPTQACDRYVTESFVTTAYGGRANCIASRKRDALARAIVIGSVDADGQRAHLVVIPKGGPYDGVKVKVELIADGGGFRVDSLQADVPAGP